jgi:hypothetical protein
MARFIVLPAAYRRTTFFVLLVIAYTAVIDSTKTKLEIISAYYPTLKALAGTSTKTNIIGTGVFSVGSASTSRAD